MASLISAQAPVFQGCLRLARILPSRNAMPHMSMKTEKVWEYQGAGVSEAESNTFEERDVAAKGNAAAGPITLRKALDDCAHRLTCYWPVQKNRAESLKLALKRRCERTAGSVSRRPVERSIRRRGGRGSFGYLLVSTEHLWRVME